MSGQTGLAGASGVCTRLADSNRIVLLCPVLLCPVRTSKDLEACALFALDHHWITTVVEKDSWFLGSIGVPYCEKIDSSTHCHTH